MNNHISTIKKDGKRKNQFPFFLAVGGAVAWWLSKKENQLQFTYWVQQAKNAVNHRLSPSQNHSTEKKPLLDKTISGKLVHEGVPFAVDYYIKKEQ